MSLVRRRRIPLTLKNMPQMTATVATHDLRPLHPKAAIRMSRHSARNGVEVRGPAAA
jgi:hypothetical protein